MRKIKTEVIKRETYYAECGNDSEIYCNKLNNNRKQMKELGFKLISEKFGGYGETSFAEFTWELNKTSQ